MTKENIALKRNNIFSVFDVVCAVLLALCPILQHYIGFAFNAALSVLILLVPYFMFRLLPKLKGFKLSHLNLVVVMIIYQIYRIIDHGTSVTEVGQSGLFILYMLFLSFGCIELKRLVSAAKYIALLASLALVLQYISFYLFKYHIQMVPTSLFISSAEQWKLCAQTGLASITGKMRNFYRPSAFFLEPSHFFIYSFPHLFLLLFNRTFSKKNLLFAGIITLGLILSTSAMGYAAVVFAWVAFFALKNWKENTFALKNIFQKRNLIALGILIVVFAIMFLFIPSINKAVMRVFSSSTNITAISGRTSKAFKLLGALKPLELVFGVSDVAHGIKFNMPGFVSTIYRHGIIGLLSYDIYIRSFLKQRISFSLVAFLIIIISFFTAHTHSTVGMLYYTFILISGYDKNDSANCGFVKFSILEIKSLFKKTKKEKA